MEKEQPQFNLELHLLEWERGFSNTSLNKDDIDELAQHLRDHFDELIQQDHMEDHQAWHIAVQTLGPHKSIAKEFEKVWYLFLKNTFAYYAVAFAPACLPFLFFRTDLLFLATMGIYLFVYRTYVDFLRLRSRNVIDRNGIWKLLLPGSRMRYLKELYL